jgi:hypothetical protein
MIDRLVNGIGMDEALSGEDSDDYRRLLNDNSDEDE